MIRFENASVTYPGGVQALRNVTLEIPDGEMMVIVGLSGAGKSTLIRAINGLVPLTGGELTIDGRSVTKARGSELREIRSRIGMIFQTFNLVKRTSVLNNVLMGRLHATPTWRSLVGRHRAEDIEIAMQALERVGIVEKAYVRASNLSGGQQQRVGIARALEQDPELLLIDEPTASLDPKTSRQIMRLICEICREQNLPAIINIHDVLLAQMFVDRIIGLRAGEVVFDGPPAALDNASLTQIYGEEDWNDMRKEADEGEADEAEAAAFKAASVERMAGAV